MKARRQLTLDEDVQAILNEQPNASGYLEDLVRDAEREWRGALVMLRSMEWSDAELCAACDVLNGWNLIPQPATWAAMSLVDAQRHNDVCAKWGVDPERWQAHATRIGQDTLAAQALVAFAREFWRRNPRAERAMGAM